MELYPIYPARKVCVKMTRNKGRGCFATEDIKRGEVIEVCPAIPISKKEWEKTLWKTTLGDYVYAGPEGNEDSYTLVVLGFSWMYNHSFRPNAVYEPGENYLVYTAKRDIKKGEEITVDYLWEDRQYYSTGILKRKKRK
jgi:SET domain-containing protein